LHAYEHSQVYLPASPTATVAASGGFSWHANELHSSSQEHAAVVVTPITATLPAVFLTVKQASSGPNKRGERTDDSKWLQLPLLGFGPFLALGNAASQGCQASDSNKWLFGTCTLLVGKQQAKAASAVEGVCL
jgi:hypothetical protein